MKRSTLMVFISLVLICVVLFAGCGGGEVKYSSIAPGGIDAYSVGAESIKLHYVPKVVEFPYGDFETSTSVMGAFWMGETEVNYLQWSIVYNWAINHGYSFANPGTRGSYCNAGDPYSAQSYESGHEYHPVTRVNWFDCIVWCNALNEYYNEQAGVNLGCVYKTSDGDIVKDSIIATIEPTNFLYNILLIDSNAKGFRLPTAFEWELAARYIGRERPVSGSLSTAAIYMGGLYWTPSGYASGAMADNTDSFTTQEVAWYEVNTLSGGLVSTQPVGSKKANALGLHDMSGNVFEWVHDNTITYAAGGSFFNNAASLSVSYRLYDGATNARFQFGFRLARNK